MMAHVANAVPYQSAAAPTHARYGSSSGSCAASTNSSSSVSSSGGAALLNNAPEVIEHKKKTSKGDMVVVGRYLKGRLLGKGGFAKCYKVTNLDSNIIYAMKIVPKATLSKRRAREKLQTEIKIHRTLRHERIVRFDQFFEDRENVYILLELCHNHSMSELMRKNKRFTDEETRRYMLQMLEATHYCHTFGIIHRDLKLGNLFLDRNWDIKVGDFGLAAKLTDDNERKRTVCGTPNYIAPEILDGSTGHSFQVDIWSLGVILYTMLVGRPPYESKDVKSTYKRILENVFSFPEGVNVNEDAKNLIRCMLQTTPDMRPSLEEILNHPFLRNGGASRHFDSSKYRIGQSSSSSSSPPTSSYVPLAKPGSCAAQVRPSRQPLGLRNSNAEQKDANASNKAKSGGVLQDAGSCAAGRAEHKAKFVLSSQTRAAHAPGVNPAAVISSGEQPFTIFSDSENTAPLPAPPSSSLSSSAARARASDGTPVQSLAGRGSAQAAYPPALGTEAAKTVGGKLQVRPPTEEKPRCDLAREFNRLGMSEVNQSESRDNLVQTQENLILALTGDPAACAGFMGLSTGGGGPSVWVKKYVDYTSKYGLGFLLSDGSSGVYFNDATKVVMEPKGPRFDYYERARNDEDVTPQRHSLDAYPSDLLKKVTLLKHFRSYLEQDGPDAQKSSGSGDEGKIGEFLGGLGQQDVAPGVPSRDRTAEGGSQAVLGNLTFLKKWVRTRHAILFRLSNGLVQVVFFDHTEVLLSNEGRLVTYVGKDGGREPLALASIVPAGRSDVVKRLKYARDMLDQVISQGRRVQ